MYKSELTVRKRSILMQAIDNEETDEDEESDDESADPTQTNSSSDEDLDEEERLLQRTILKNFLARQKAHDLSEVKPSRQVRESGESFVNVEGSMRLTLSARNSWFNSARMSSTLQSTDKATN